ncbi:uncharacterized protein TM35_000161910 [Trypanosoma theileri]|uniref:RRM domain-containing protein n=1 Tax=Trypanosoma theileri TaxID=67003 RepID=A0A1X0NVQ3_9TRYP|nr:uncharacterized protein TM35_000161910 [Trypanosoma theileri]ORC88553.1 hypothetical protein TM35_000161910 [Trypanosoma theileri]
MTQPKKDHASELLDKYFGDAYLFEHANAFFREKVSPKDTTNLTTPPTITCASFLRFANCTVDEKNISSLCEAAGSSSIVEAVKGEDGSWCLRRRRFLDPKDDPALRSVVVWPLHRASKPDEVTAFFNAYGVVESATVMMRPHGDTQPHASFVVRFATVEEATNCTKANISFGKAPSALAQHFLPARVHAVLMEEYLAKMEEKNRVKEESQLQHNVVKAQKALAELQDNSVRRFLRKGVTLKVEGVPPGTTWQTMKMKLGNLSITNPVLKKGITLLRVEEPETSSSSSSGDAAAAGCKQRRAFVICRDEAVARELRSSFSLADGDFGRELRAVCPNLLPLTDAEEEYARQHFPQWCERRVEAKQADNRKRQRNF